MSCIIEGSLEILRPVAVAGKELKGDDCTSRTRLTASDDENSFVQHQQTAQHHADKKPKESRTKQKQGEEESDDFDDSDSDSFMKTDEASGSDEEEELGREDKRERGRPIKLKKLDDAKWQSKFELLRQYKQENGHCQSSTTL